MKAKAFIIILILVAVGLGIALIVLNNNADEYRQHAESRIANLSNEVNTIRARLEEVQIASRELETNLTTSRVEFSNKLAVAETSLATANTELAKVRAEAKAAADSAAGEMAQRDKKIADLESQNQTLDKQSADLRASITERESQIAETQKKLTASEGDRQFLLKELQRLQAEKADLERKFNDLAILKEQVRKLKEELSISRRLDWLRRGIYDTLSQKGAERLMHPTPSAPPSANKVLEVEVKQDGSVKVGGQSSTNPPVPPPVAPAPTLSIPK